MLGVTTEWIRRKLGLEPRMAFFEEAQPEVIVKTDKLLNKENSETIKKMITEVIRETKAEERRYEQKEKESRETLAKKEKEKVRAVQEFRRKFRDERKDIFVKIAKDEEIRRLIEENIDLKYEIERLKGRK